MVKEREQNKPYTEYVIQVKWNAKTWKVPRKYRHFCELHQELQENFPGLQFPKSASFILHEAVDINNYFKNKKTTFIEEKRKAL